MSKRERMVRRGPLLDRCSSSQLEGSYQTQHIKRLSNIELVIDEVDTHQHLLARILRSKKPVGVRQELYGVLLAHYAVRAAMHESACQADLDPDRLSFVGSLRILVSTII